MPAVTRAAMAVAITLAITQRAAAASKEYVDGIGWLPTVVVSTCLRAAGEDETDALHDASWEEFLACVADQKH